MAEEETMKWLRRINRNVTESRAEIQRGLASLDEEQEEQNEAIRRHEALLRDHEKRLRSLERDRK